MKKNAQKTNFLKKPLEKERISTNFPPENLTLSSIERNNLPQKHFTVDGQNYTISTWEYKEVEKPKTSTFLPLIKNSTVPPKKKMTIIKKLGASPFPKKNPALFFIETKYKPTSKKTFPEPNKTYDSPNPPTTNPTLPPMKKKYKLHSETQNVASSSSKKLKNKKPEKEKFMPRRKEHTVLPKTKTALSGRLEDYYEYFNNFRDYYNQNIKSQPSIMKKTKANLLSAKPTPLAKTRRTSMAKSSQKSRKHHRALTKKMKKDTKHGKSGTFSSKIRRMFATNDSQEYVLNTWENNRKLVHKYFSDKQSSIFETRKYFFSNKRMTTNAKLGDVSEHVICTWENKGGREESKKKYGKRLKKYRKETEKFWNEAFEETKCFHSKMKSTLKADKRPH